MFIIFYRMTDPSKHYIQTEDKRGHLTIRTIHSYGFGLQIINVAFTETLNVLILTGGYQPTSVVNIGEIYIDFSMFLKSIIGRSRSKHIIPTKLQTPQSVTKELSLNSFIIRYASALQIYHVEVNESLKNYTKELHE